MSAFFEEELPKNLHLLQKVNGVIKPILFNISEYSCNITKKNIKFLIILSINLAKQNKFFEDGGLAYDFTDISDKKIVPFASYKSNLFKVYDKNNGSLLYFLKNEKNENIEFIDSVLANLFLQKLHDPNHPSVKYPKIGYGMSYLGFSKRIIGVINPFLQNWTSLGHLIENYRPKNKSISFSPRDELNIHQKGFHIKDYLGNLTEYINKTDPQSIADFYVDQYISGGADPHPSNWGFTKTDKGKFIIGKLI